MVPTRPATRCDPFIHHHVENRLTENGVLLYTDLRVNTLECIGNALGHVDRAMDIETKQLQWIDCNTFTTRMDFNDFRVSHELTRGRPDGKALSVVKHNGWGLLLGKFSQNTAARIRFTSRFHPGSTGEG